MPEISYKDFNDHLREIEGTISDQSSQVYLFYGEELLYKKAFSSLIDSLVPPDDRIANCETIDGAPENIRDAVNCANTYSLLAGKKVVAVQESRIFYGNQEKKKLFDKARDAFRRGDNKKASKYILSMMGQLSLELEDVKEKEDIGPLLKESGSGENNDWVLDVIHFSRENGLSVPSGNRPDQFLETAVEKGFPKGNYLVLTTDLVDKRRVLYKRIREKGIVVDCSVPKGDRKADRQIQEMVLRDRAETVIGGSKKFLSPPAFARLYEMTGFDLRTFSNSLEKLVLYIGERTEITADDVTDVLERSKKDPIYELTGAISDRKPILSIQLIDSLLQSGLHHLQIFTAIVNQMRKLMLVKTFIMSHHGSAWQSGTSYNAFNARVLPAMVAYDGGIVEMIATWEERLAPERTDQEGENKKRKKNGKKKNKKAPTDILVAANPKNPYPIYLTMKKADNFSMEELMDLYIQLGHLDMKLKRSARDPKLLLETAVLKICKTKRREKIR